jgi:hypothetical protein
LVGAVSENRNNQRHQISKASGLIDLPSICPLHNQ